jgi:hypothetical protein
MKYVEFDLYIPLGYDPKRLIGVQSQMEIGSGGMQDQNELTYGMGPKIYNDLIYGFWNHIIIPIDEFHNDEGDGYDITRINYIGLYWNANDNDNKYEIPNCKIKNFKFSNYIL